jgi:hypothetical protein
MIFMEARFIGANGSMGLTHGRVYLLRIEKSTSTFNRIIRTAIFNGDAEAKFCPYESIESLLINWDNLKHVDEKYLTNEYKVPWE